jgi:hypothetical protein
MEIPTTAVRPMPEATVRDVTLVTGSMDSSDDIGSVVIRCAGMSKDALMKFVAEEIDAE